MKALKICNCGAVSFVDIPSNGSLPEFQELVGGRIEALGFPCDSHAYINDEGKLLELPVNKVATAICVLLEIGLMPGDFIHGPMVILSDGPDGGEASISPELIKLIADATIGKGADISVFMDDKSKQVWESLMQKAGEK